MKRQRGELRQNAQNAKMRLANGFWNDKEKSKAEILKKATDTSTALHVFSHTIRAQLGTRDEEFEAFYAIALPHLIKGTTNLHRVLLNQEHIENLSTENKERYIFSLTRKIQRCVERYNSEKLLAVGE